MGTRSTNVTIRANTAYDNFSVNIYTNSENALIERNLVYCTLNSRYEREGLPAIGIGMGEEYFDGWGARLKNAKVINNIVAFCKHGVRYDGADDRLTGGGLKNATIAYNTLYGSTNSALSIVYESAQAGSLIANNIVWQAQDKLTYINNPIGLTFKNNLWKVLPSNAVRSSGDKIGDPKFASTPAYISESYRPGSPSPAAGSATDIGISNDFFAKQRGPSFDIGAIQFATIAPSSVIQPTATSIPPTTSPTNTLLTSTSQATATSITSTIQSTNTSAAASPTPTDVPPTATLTFFPPTTTSTNVPTQPSSTATLQPTPQSSQETLYDNKDSTFIYSTGWIEEIKSTAIGGSYARTPTNGSSVTFQFTGQSFSIMYKGDPSYRKMNVYLDGPW